ncbi:hypothetical protein EVAR_89698_1 [Eumeta japonica]|uniref:Uncharacterized protein n=1 Tax=Eumeta variegata TaxID=151549 RepID=A0A4C1WY89_EUMVA|nr:hypothetical protein EVAR_89698_1 [Eumeta japonica]
MTVGPPTIDGSRSGSSNSGARYDTAWNHYEKKTVYQFQRYGFRSRTYFDPEVRPPKLTNVALLQHSQPTSIAHNNGPLSVPFACARSVTYSYRKIQKHENCSLKVIIYTDSNSLFRLTTDAASISAPSKNVIAELITVGFVLVQFNARRVAQSSL